MPWALGGAAVLLGSIDAVSGASAGVSGLTKYAGTTVAGTPTNRVVEPVGQSFKYRITVRNPGSDFLENYFNCVPLPPGLTIDTRLGAAGYITGTPTVAGTYEVTLFAGNVNYPEPATATATIVVVEPSAPPVITAQPMDLSLIWQGKGLMSVTASGTEPLGYRWLHNGNWVVGEESGSLALVATTFGIAGQYQCVVTNGFGSVTSVVAQVVVQQPLNVPLKYAAVQQTASALQLDVTGPFQTNYVTWISSDLTHWTALQTNWVMDGAVHLVFPMEPGTGAWFHRVTTGP